MTWIADVIAIVRKLVDLIPRRTPPDSQKADALLGDVEDLRAKSQRRSN